MHYSLIGIDKVLALQSFLFLMQKKVVWFLML
jgi:hypothetical protein